MAEKLVDIIVSLFNVLEDSTVPRNVREKIDEIIITLKNEGEISIKVHKVLNYLDEIAADINLQPYTRSLIWSIVSELEKI